MTVDLVDNRATTSTGTDTLVSIERARGTTATMSCSA